MAQTTTPTLTYRMLKEQVQTILLETQREIDALKVRTYWQTGKLIADYLELQPQVQKHTSKLLTRLAKDLQMEQSIFFRLLQFVESFPQGLVPGRNLTWTHYRVLLAVADDGQRESLAKEADDKAWPVRRLREEIFKRKRPKKKTDRLPVAAPLEEPERTRFGVHRIKQLMRVKGEPVLSVDLGFEIYQVLSAAESRRFKEKDMVMFSKQKGKWDKAGSAEELYYYPAQVAHVVDGDTLLVYVDFGFGMRKRQYLRLRGLDTPPLETPKGKQANAYLARVIGQATRVTFKSRSRDPYGRYLSDVWVDDLYVNQSILDRGLAKRL